ncbi:carboxylesterase family protein [Streptomyces sp. RPT161]|uniref:carboxylesterase family protein n=1 Tax=Streptomyces sp. RPT161 TaxID=3015993 RepID=UPI0022B872BB|nr:carboxylesterase family protein [Streptomyces sp. RPT161]
MAKPYVLTELTHSDSASPAHPCDVVVRTTEGLVAGTRHPEFAVFRGVPYARPPLGALRFSSPLPPVAWDGVRDARRFVPPFLQPGVPESREDALYANVWTPDVRGSRPVLVYVHGGGWQIGGGELATYDGARPAVRGDLVVVTFNYRLGAFGFGLHEDLTDPRTGSFANWGLQDQVELLRWVRRNAAAFGGDPGNVTLSGTSAGGASAWQLALLPQVRPLIRRIVPLSPCHVWQPAVGLTAEDSRTVYAAIARRLGTDVRGLRHVPAGALLDAWQRVFSGSPATRLVASGREYRGPVPDGRWMRGFDHQLPAPDLPSLIVYTRTEGAFFTVPGLSALPAPPAPRDEPELRAAVRRVLEKRTPDVSDRLVDDCLTAYRQAAAAEGLPRDPLSLWTGIWGDGLFRYPIVRLAERDAGERQPAQYLMEFAHPTRPPAFGTPHEATSRFLFGTHGIEENAWAYGDGPSERRVCDMFIDLVASFARDGVPSAAGVSDWPVFHPGRPTTLVLGADGTAQADGPRLARLATTPYPRSLRFWDDVGWVPRP